MVGGASIKIKENITKIFHSFPTLYSNDYILNILPTTVCGLRVGKLMVLKLVVFIRSTGTGTNVVA